VYSSFWVALIVGILSLRYRDLIPITQSLMRMLFFASPIIWMEKHLGTWGNLINTINPVRYFLAVVRSPLLDEPVGLDIYTVTIAMALVLTIAGLSLLAFTRNKIAYWL
jgi:ABC-type polysaccharide/polyol phosphate export permease